MNRSSLLFIKEPHYLKLGGFSLFEEVKYEENYKRTKVRY